MIGWLQNNINKFFRSELDFRVRMFNLLAMVGTVVSLLMAVASLRSGGGQIHAMINLVLAGLSFGLLYYSYISSQYQRCYLVTIFAIFFIGFSFVFLSGGGYHSAMPSFFIFSTVFTVFMLEGWLMVMISTLELVFYVGLCIYAYYAPTRIVWLAGEQEVLVDIVVGFVSVSVALGITMYFSFHMYNRQQRQLEQAREEAVQADRAKSMFLAKMSHEIRTPINIMLGMNEMTLRERPTTEVINYIRRSQDAGHMLLSLINDVLDVAKIESGKLELREEVYFTAGLIDELTRLGKEQSEKKGLTFTTEISGIPAMLWGDRLHIRQIVANFLSNAVKFTQAGSVKLSITGVDPFGKDDIALSIAVQDTGIGIRKESLDIIFDAFGRGRTACSLGIEGTGLGLAIVKELTTLMGGHLSVRSEYGIGSSFQIDIPQRRVCDAAEVMSETAAPETEQSFLAPQGRILVVDDNTGNLSVIKSLLARTLLKVDTATDGRSCIDLALCNQYHLILLDYMMPQMDGIETLHELQRMNCKTPVVVLTADVTSGTQQRLLGEGFEGYLAKPFPWVLLEQTLLSFLPQELVERVPINRVLTGSVPPEALCRQLAQHDISLVDGLSFLNGSLSQYKIVAGLFYAHTIDTANLLTQLASADDLAAISHLVHSLKTQAHIVGAEALAATARRIEQKFRQEEMKYVRAAIPLLLCELEHVRQGISHNLLVTDPVAGRSESISFLTKEDLEELSARASCHIADYHSAESRQALLTLLELEHDPVAQELLKTTCKAVDELNFEDAEMLFKKFRESM